MWTKSSLQQLIRTRLEDQRFIVVANREPYQHRFSKSGEIECVSAVSGMVTALDPILRATGGTWVAHGSGDADHTTADADGRLSVPPEDPTYALRRVWLSEAQEEGYYNGLANGGLWPLCHKVFVRPTFKSQHWETYREVNDLFAQAVLDEAGAEPAFIFIQDYHYGLLPRMLRQGGANLIVAQFWHIPWPSPEVFNIFPWKEELLEGLLGNDVLGFHLRHHCQNFLNTVDQTLEAKVDYERFEITRGGRTTLVRPFPIGIDFEAHSEDAENAAVQKAMMRWQRELNLERGRTLGIGIDRMDFTKGIPERLRAIDRYLQTHPEAVERLVFLQIGVPTRTQVIQYQELDDEVDTLVEGINSRWGTEDWQPVVFLKRQYGPVDMMALHQLADFCIVSSLDDGMNLVAKEFVASRNDNDGVLILSRFTGAARELTSALIVNPFATDEMCEAIETAVSMPPEARRKRMQKLREAVAENNVYRWAGKFMSTLFKFEFPENGTGVGEEVLAWAAR